MNCANWEEPIALYMGGDLRAEDAAKVKRHLAECAGCQVFASGMRESLAVLREAHAEDLPEAGLAAVRARVMGTLREGRRSFWRSAWVPALAGAVWLLAIVYMRPPARNHVEVARQTLPPALPSAVAVAAPPVASEPAPAHAAKVRRHRPAKPVGPPLLAVSPEKPLVVKLVTDDPDVVIYWISDTRGE